MKIKSHKIWLTAVLLIVVLALVSIWIFHLRSERLERSERSLPPSAKTAKSSNQNQTEANKVSSSSPGNGVVTINGKHYANKHGKELFSAVLIGKAEGDSVKLMWILRGWPDSMTGVVVKRKQNNDSWHYLVNEQAVIRPAIGPGRDWAAQGMTATQTEEYRNKLKKLADSGKIKFVKTNEFIAFLKEKGVRGGDRIAMTNNNDLAFFMGFGAIDNAPTKGDEYGVFAVDQKGKVAESPFATWENKAFSLNELNLSNIQPFIKQKKIGFSWTLPQKQNTKYGLIGFDVLKCQDNSWQLLGRTYGIPKGEILNFSFVDTQTNAVGKHRYAISAVNYFNECSPRLEFEFDEKQFGDAAPPELTELKTEQEDISVSGKILKTDLDKVKSITLERCSDLNDEFGSIGELSTPTTEFSLIDKTSKELERYYFYRWMILLKNGNTLFSAQKGVASPARLPKLPTPANFKVERIHNGKSHELRFTWDKVSDAKSYRFYQKTNNSPELAQLRAVADNSFTLPYPAQYDTQIWSFGIAAEPEDLGKFSSSELAVIKDFLMPVANPCPVKNLKAEVNLNTIQLQWENPEPSVTSFEILLNGESKLKLPAMARTAELKHVTKTQKGEGASGMIEIAVVSYNELGNAKTSTSFFFNVPDPCTSKIPCVSNFQGKLKGDGVRRMVELSWDPLSKEKDNVDGIRLRYEIPELNDLGTILERTYKGEIPNKINFEIPKKATAGMKIIFKIEALRIVPVNNSLPTFSGSWTCVVLNIK